MLLGLAEGGPWRAPCTVTGPPAVPTAVPPPLVRTCSPMDPLSLNLAFVFAAGRAAQCDVRQKSPCPQGLALLLRPPLAWPLQQHAEASGAGERGAGPLVDCCLPPARDPQPQPPFLGTRDGHEAPTEVQGRLREDGLGRITWHRGAWCPKDAVVLGRARPSNGSLA